MLRWAAEDRTSWMFNCQKACEKLAHVHTHIGAGLRWICKQQLKPAEINVPRWQFLDTGFLTNSNRSSGRVASDQFRPKTDSNSVAPIARSNHASMEA